MVHRPQKSEFWHYVLPSMFSQMLASFFIVVDGFFIGQNLGNVGLAAINVAWPIVATIQSVGLAIGTGGAVYLSMARGQGETKKLLTARANSIVLLAIAGVVLGLSLFFLYPVILPAIGGRGELYPPAVQYTKVVCAMTGFQLFSTGLLPLLRGIGRTMTAMNSMIVGLVANILLDWLFIQVFQWGLAGAAFATGLSQAITVVISMWVLLTQKDMPLERQQFRLYRPFLKKVAQFGVSPFGLSMSISVILLFTNLQALAYGGTSGVAVYAVLSYVLGSVVPLITGVGEGVQPLLSFAKGAGNEAEVHRLRRSGLSLALGISVVCSIACYLARYQLPALFGAAPDAIKQAADAMWTLAVAYPFVAVVRFCSSYFTAVGHPKAGSLLAYGEPLAAQPLFLFSLPLLFALDGVWISYPAATAAMAVLALWLVRRQRNAMHA